MTTNKLNKIRGFSCQRFSFASYCLLIALMIFSNVGIIHAQQSLINDYDKADTILVGSEPDYPPFCLVNARGEADGFAVEIFKAAAEAVNLHVNIKVGVWSMVKQDLAEGKIDALPLVGRTPEREKLFDFTMTYLSLHGAVFVRDDYEGIKNPSDLKGKQIIVMKGDNAEEFLRREKITNNIITTHTFEEAFRLLEKGQHDAVVTQRIMGINLLEEMNINSIHPLDFQLDNFRQDFCFAVQNGNEKLVNRLNEGLSIIIANNTYREIKQKWFGPEGGVSMKDIWRYILLGLIPLVIIGILLWIVFLRKEVKRHTSKLNNEIAQHRQTLENLNVKQEKLKESEANIRLLLNSAAEGMFRIDVNGNCTMINKAAIGFLRYDNENEVLGRNMHKLIHHTNKNGEESNVDSCNILKSIREEKGTHSSDAIFWRKDGSSFQVEYFSYPIFEKEKIKGSVVTFRDITERKKDEEELIRLKNNLEAQVAQRTSDLKEKITTLNRSQKAMLYMVEDLNKITAELKEERHKLELSNKELEAFTYSVSHDLRAPLRAIHGYSKFLVEDYKDKLDDNGNRYIDTIQRNALKMNHLITDLLNLSRISRTRIQKTNTDMNAVVWSVFEEVATGQEKKEFDFIVNNLPDVSCDESLIRQVWQNLISNSLKYSSKSKTKRIEISSKTEKNAVYFYIKDYGAGFNEKYVNKLFGVFQRLHKDTEYQGTGVGLAIVQRIIQRHGGDISAKGTEAHGALFVFYIPL